MCVYIITCVAPTWGLLDGKRGFGLSWRCTGQRQTTRKQDRQGSWYSTHSEAVCICVLSSPASSECPEVNAAHYNIHEAARLLSWVKAKLDVTKLTLSPLPWGENGKMSVATVKRHRWGTAGGCDWGSLCLCVCVCVYKSGGILAHALMKTTYFRVVIVALKLQYVHPWLASKTKDWTWNVRWNAAFLCEGQLSSFVVCC